METVIGFFTFDRFLEILGFCLGLLYLYWEYHADPKMWFATIVMPPISCWIYFRSGLYADCGMSAYYFFMAIYGYIMWTRLNRKSAQGTTQSPGAEKGKAAKGRPISHIKPRQVAGCLLAFVAVYAAILLTLKQTDSTVPYWDAFTTAASIIATWMLAQKFIEQWWAWIAVDAVSSCLYMYKDRPFYSILYAVYTAVAFFGYCKWKRLMAAQTEQD